MLIGFKTLVINVFHMSCEIFTFTKRKKKFQTKNNCFIEHLEFPTKIKERSIGIKILIGFLNPTENHIFILEYYMCELNSCRKYLSRIGNINPVGFLENLIRFSLFPVRYLFLWECNIS